PQLLLLDEPLSALDPGFREEIQEYLKILNSEGITIVMVTHDFGEVLSLGDRVAVLKEGILRQVGNVAEVFKSPADPVVADFVGMKNLIPCDIKTNTAISLDGISFAISHSGPQGCTFLGIRPEDIAIARVAPEVKDQCNIFQGEIISIISRGTVIEVVVSVENSRFVSYILASSLVEMKLQVGDQVYLRIKPEIIHAL
ncbi:MAG: TOBE domain-containing protein, partial [Synergistales bacterium]|nr:TOBE domain-containing protein [Synergistales bacterium]